MKLYFTNRRFWLVLTMALIGTGSVRAELISRQGGKMLYDPFLNITWLADGNSFATELHKDPDLIYKVIAAVPTVRALQGNFTVSYRDFMDSNHSANGSMTWIGAQAWVDYLNIGGRDDWRLPTVDYPCRGVACTSPSNEYPWLMSFELGGQPSKPIGDVHNSKFDLFQNIVNSWYWSSTEDVLPGCCNYRAWGYDAQVNSQGTLPFYYDPDSGPLLWYYGFAMAVVEGDIGELPSVPLSGAAWLFLSGFLLTLRHIGLKRA